MKSSLKIFSIGVIIVLLYLYYTMKLTSRQENFQGLRSKTTVHYHRLKRGARIQMEQFTNNIKYKVKDKLQKIGF
jgi:hypothetical protein